MEPNTSTASSAPLLGPGELLSSAWATFKKHWKFLVLLYLVPGFIVYVGNILMSFEGISVTIAAVILIILGGIWSITVYPATINAIRSYTSDPGAVLSLKEQYKFGLRYLLPMVWVVILQNVVFLGSAVLFIIPAIVVSIYLAFTQFSLVLDDKRGYEVLTTSYSAVHGRWWPVLGRILVLGIILMIGAMILIAIGTFVGSLLGVDLSNEDNLVTDTTNLIVTALIVPFSTAYLYRLYTSLKSTAVEVSTAAFRKWLTAFTIIGILVIIALIIAALIGGPYLLDATAA